MPSFSPSLTLLVLILSLHLCISVSQKTEKFGYARRILASIEEGEEEDQQPLPKPKKKPIFDPKSQKADTSDSKKSSTLIDDQDHSLPKLKKKLSSNTITQKADTFDTTSSKEEDSKPKKKLISNTITQKADTFDTTSSKEDPKPKKKLTSSSKPPKADTIGTKKSLASSKEEDEEEEEEQLLPKRKKKLTYSSNTQDTDTSSTDQEQDETQALPKPKKKLTLESRNQTKPLLLKPKKTNSTTMSDSIKKLNKTLTSAPKPSNSTKTQPKSTTPNPTKKTSPKPKLDQSLSWLEDETDGQDFITEFRDLPSRLIPDLEKISTTSQAYLRKYNKEIEHNIRPIVGAKYAPTIASLASFLFLILPLLLATALFRHLKGYLSIQRVLIFIQAYLAIYFATLSLTATVTGLEPLRFFYASAPETYAWTQAVQTLGYVLYLIVQLINLVVVFSSPANEFTAGARALGLAQMLVGLAVGLHYYVSVFHRAVTGEPPRANWKVHGIYALCFLVICAFARAERRKKAYLQDGGDYGKKS